VILDRWSEPARGARHRDSLSASLIQPGDPGRLGQQLGAGLEHDSRSPQQRPSSFARRAVFVT